MIGRYATTIGPLEFRSSGELVKEDWNLEPLAYSAFVATRDKEYIQSFDTGETGELLGSLTSMLCCCQSLGDSTTLCVGLGDFEVLFLRNAVLGGT